MAAPLEAAVNAAQAARAAQGLGPAPVALLAPVGKRYDQAGAEALAAALREQGFDASSTLDLEKAVREVLRALAADDEAPPLSDLPVAEESVHERTRPSRVRARRTHA